MSKKSYLLSVMVLGLSAVTAFAGRPASVTPEETLKKLGKANQAANQSIQLLVESDLSCNADAECSAIALGDKACGGPTNYVVVSLNNRFVVDGTVGNLAKQTEEIDREINTISGMMSDCMFLMPPETSCVANACRNSWAK